jgi:hypothetical protein
MIVTIVIFTRETGPSRLIVTDRHKNSNIVTDLSGRMTVMTMLTIFPLLCIFDQLGKGATDVIDVIRKFTGAQRRMPALASSVTLHSHLCNCRRMTAY